MAEKRITLKSEIKRQVRKECYFGCVICGAPLFDYDHIINYSEVKEHTVDNITLLCRSHHTDKTAGRLSIERVKEARLNPFNKSKEITSKHLLISNKEIKILLGSNSASKNFSYDHRDYHVLWIEGMSYFTIHYEEGYLTFSFKLTDIDGNIIAIADKGEIGITTKKWDYTYEGKTIKIWEKNRHIILEATLSNYLIEIKNGIFMNKNKSGYLIKDDALHTYVKDNNCGISMGCSSRDNGFAGWAIGNSINTPRGVGFMRGTEIKL